MRVGLVCPYDLGRPGGVQDQVIRLAGWLRDAGHDAMVVGPGTEGPPGAVLLGATRVVTANRSTAPVRLDPRIGRGIDDLIRNLFGDPVIEVEDLGFVFSIIGDPD